MSVTQAEIKWYKSEVVNDTNANGGRLSSNEIQDGVKNNIFPDVPQAERVAGSTKYRKVFIKIANDDDLGLINPSLFVETQTPGDDLITIFPGTQRDTQLNITGSERQYGAGQLNADVLAGVNSIDVLTEDGTTTQIFFAGDTLRISDKTDVNDLGGNEEEHVIDSVSYAGDIATITLVGTLANAYTAADTRVASVFEPGATIEALFSGFTVTSGSGTYDETGGNLAVDHIGGIEQDWTLSFTSSTAFDIIGDTLGTIGTGNISTDTIPSNPDFAKPYFTLLAAGFGGTFQAGDTITFTTSPAATPIWYKRKVPAGAGSISNNSGIVAVDGESQ